MIIQCGIIFAFLAAGEFLVWLTGVPVPSSILGMIMLAAALQAGWVKERWVSRIADFLVRNLGFFFVPAGVGLMQCLGIIRDQWFAITAATVLSTLAIIATTGWVHQIVRRAVSRHPRRQSGSKSAANR